MSALSVLRAGMPSAARLWSVSSMLAALSAVLSMVLSAPVPTAATLLVAAAIGVLAAALCTRRRRGRGEIG